MVISPRASASNRILFASTQAPMTLVTAAGSTMYIAPRPAAYMNPGPPMNANPETDTETDATVSLGICLGVCVHRRAGGHIRSEEHTPELQARFALGCRLVPEQKKAAGRW